MELTVFEHWTEFAVRLGIRDPERYYLGRFVALSSREVIQTFDLKKRRYISTTSMDAELALITANIAHAGPGKLFYDPLRRDGRVPRRRGPLGRPDLGERHRPAADARRQCRAVTEGKLPAVRPCSLALEDVFTADLTHSPIRPAAAGVADRRRRRTEER